MLKKKLSLILILAASVYITACCSCGAQGDNTVKGYITIVGNEPFAKLAIMLEDNKTFILKCEKDLEDELWKQQGNYFIIEFSESKVEIGEPVLIVEKATPLNQSTTK